IPTSSLRAGSAARSPVNRAAEPARSDDVGMTKKLEHFALDAHPIDHVGLLGKRGFQDFDDDWLRALEPDGLVDFAHPSRGEPTDGTVRCSRKDLLDFFRGFRAHVSSSRTGARWTAQL